MRPLLLALLTTALIAGETTPPVKAEVDALLTQAQAWLLSQQQADGAFVPGKTFTLGITAMATMALASPPHALPKNHPALVKALSYIDSFRQKDGGVYAIDEGLGNYTTSLALQIYVLIRPDNRAPIEASRRIPVPSASSNCGSSNTASTISLPPNVDLTN